MNKEGLLGGLRARKGVPSMNTHTKLRGVFMLVAVVM